MASEQHERLPVVLPFNLAPSEVQTFLKIPRDTPLQPIYDEIVRLAAAPECSDEPAAVLFAKTAEFDRGLFLSHCDVEFARSKESVLAMVAEQNATFEREFRNRARNCAEPPLDALAWQRRLAFLYTMFDASTDETSSSSTERHMLQMQLNALGENSRLLFQSMEMLLAMPDADRLPKQKLLSDEWLALLTRRQTNLALLLIELATLFSTDLLLEPATRVREVVRNVLTFVKELHEALREQWEFLAADDAVEEVEPRVTVNSLLSQTRRSGTRLLRRELVAVEPSSDASRSHSPSRKQRYYFNDRDVLLSEAAGELRQQQEEALNAGATSAALTSERTLSPAELYRAFVSSAASGWQTAVTMGVINLLFAGVSYLAHARQAANWAAEHQAVSNAFLTGVAGVFGYDPATSNALHLFALPYLVYQWLAWFLIGANQSQPPWDWMYTAFVNAMLRNVPAPIYFTARYTIENVSWVGVAQRMYNLYALYRVARNSVAVALADADSERKRLISETQRSMFSRFIQYAYEVTRRRQNPLDAMAQQRDGDVLAPLLLNQVENDNSERNYNSSSDDENNDDDDDNSTRYKKKQPRAVLPPPPLLQMPSNPKRIILVEQQLPAARSEAAGYDDARSRSPALRRRALRKK